MAYTSPNYTELGHIGRIININKELLNVKRKSYNKINYCNKKIMTYTILPEDNVKFKIRCINYIWIRCW